MMLPFFGCVFMQDEESSVFSGDLDKNDAEKNFSLATSINTFKPPPSVAKLQKIVEFLTKEFPKPVPNAKTTYAKAKRDYIAAFIIRLGCVVLSVIVSVEFGLKNMSVVQHFIKQLQLERDVYWLSDVLGFALSFLSNVLVNALILMSLEKDEKCPKAVSAIGGILAYALALFPAAVFVKTMLEEGLNPVFIGFAFLIRLMQLGNGLLALWSRVQKHIQFNKYLNSRLKKGLHVFGILVALAATGIIGFRNGEPMPFDNSNINEDVVSKSLGQFFVWMGDWPKTAKTTVQGLNAVAYAACFADSTLAGIGATIYSLVQGLMFGQSVFHIVLPFGAIGAFGNIADALADQAANMSVTTHMPYIVTTQALNATTNKPGVDLFNAIQVPEQFATTYFINLMSTIKLIILTMAAFRLFFDSCKTSCCKRQKQPLKDGKVKLLDVTGSKSSEALSKEPITDLLNAYSSPMLATTLLYLIGTPLCVIPFIVGLMFLCGQCSSKNKAGDSQLMTVKNFMPTFYSELERYRIFKVPAKELGTVGQDDISVSSEESTMSHS